MRNIESYIIMYHVKTINKNRGYIFVESIQWWLSRKKGGKPIVAGSSCWCSVCMVVSSSFIHLGGLPDLSQSPMLRSDWDIWNDSTMWCSFLMIFFIYIFFVLFASQLFFCWTQAPRDHLFQFGILLLSLLWLPGWCSMKVYVSGLQKHLLKCGFLYLCCLAECL